MVEKFVYEIICRVISSKNDKKKFKHLELEKKKYNIILSMNIMSNWSIYPAF